MKKFFLGFFIAFSLFLGQLNKVYAQHKLELARVEFRFIKNSAEICISRSGDDIEIIEVELEKVNSKSSALNFSPLLEHINKMIDEGWELITIDGGIYYLERDID